MASRRRACFQQGENTLAVLATRAGLVKEGGLCQ
jgi:hypothetical protein